MVKEIAPGVTRGISAEGTKVPEASHFRTGEVSKQKQDIVASAGYR